MTKSDIRRITKARLRDLSLEARKEASERIVQHLMDTPDWAPPAGGKVSLFGGAMPEPQLLPLLPWLAQRGVGAVFFAIEENLLIPYGVKDAKDLVSAALGVLEPCKNGLDRLSVSSLDTILVPGVAFADDGTRLGHGKGHYDRLMSAPDCHAKIVGVCFDVQRVPSLPRESHDVLIPRVVTESGWRMLGD